MGANEREKRKPFVIPSGFKVKLISALPAEVDPEIKDTPKTSHAPKCFYGNYTKI